ncbi:MAG TPA: DUF1127 domain-containing protein [Arsenicitalea sp.]|jgi:uncharacterized protein YjiS (DUF1127 family)|nr:DUF1127 domain-containing protein [Arsenicitalea sp.]
MKTYFNTLRRNSRARRAYRLLSTLDDRLLADIGVTRAEVRDIAGGRADRFPARFGSHE